MEATIVNFGSYNATGPASGSTFSGSNNDSGGVDVSLPDGTFAKFRLAWSLRLIQR
jgi:hypothetical protein